MNSNEKLALSNCDREPVHIPGRIQSFGAMIGFDLRTSQLCYYSDNLRTLFPELNPPSFNVSYESLFSNRDIIHAIRGGLGLPSISLQRDRVGAFDIGSTKTDIGLYTTGGIGVIELEPDHLLSSRPQTPVAVVKSMISSLNTGSGVKPLMDSAVTALRYLTGFDRIMGYQFLENDDGEVISEDKGNGIEPFLGLRYPASDIPQQARMLMMRAHFRLIGSTDDPHATILSDDNAPQLDMSLSHLRGVSPIHVEYLKNMGVRATMNSSIIVRGKLWGLFAFHHYRPRKVSPDQRSICELFSQLVSMQIQQEMEQTTFDRRAHAQSLMQDRAVSSQTPEQVFNESAQDFRKIVNCAGAALVKGSHVVSEGDTPTDAAITNLMGLANKDFVALDHLATTEIADKETLGNTAGALILKVGHQSHLVFFRNEISTEIRWAGGKEKQISYGPNGPRLSPRASFDEYVESVSGLCEPWSDVDISGATEIASAFQRLISDASGELSQYLEQQKRYQDLLIAELNHRVRNTLALVRSIARQTRSSTASLDQYIESLEQRISALSKAHDLIGGSGLQWARIEDLINAELKPYLNSDASVELTGTKIAVRADVAPIISLLFHEMASNAVKHGALSINGESLHVSWQEQDGGVAISWIEKLKSDVGVPERRGFGFALIERAIPYECNGKSDIQFNGKQLKIDFWLPAESVHRLSSAQEHLLDDVGVETATAPEKNPLSAISSIMIVEDNMVLAMEMERLLLEMGIGKVEAYPNANLAMGALEHTKYDAAILDINLGDGTSFDLGLKLHRLNTPLVFVSGYGSQYEFPAELTRTPQLTKPVNRTELILALETSTRATSQ